MEVKDYTIEKLVEGLKEYKNKLAVAKQGDKRRNQTKLDITFYGAMATLFETELSSRLPL